MNFNHKPGFPFRILFVLLLFLIAGYFMVARSSISYADDAKKPEEICQCPNIKDMEVITIDNKGYKKIRKGPVKFEHIKHARDYKISCWECHHDYNKDSNNKWIVPKPQVAQEIQNAEGNGTGITKEEEAQENLNIWTPWGKTKKCIECHDPKEKKDNVIMLQAAYHKNCKGCHIERRIYKNNYLAYRDCTKCHEDISTGQKDTK